MTTTRIVKFKQTREYKISYNLFGLRENEEKYSRIDQKLAYFHPTILYSPPLFPLPSQSKWTLNVMASAFAACNMNW